MLGLAFVTLMLLVQGTILLVEKIQMKTVSALMKLARNAVNVTILYNADGLTQFFLLIVVLSECRYLSRYCVMFPCFVDSKDT